MKTCGRKTSIVAVGERRVISLGAVKPRNRILLRWLVFAAKNWSLFITRIPSPCL